MYIYAFCGQDTCNRSIVGGNNALPILEVTSSGFSHLHTPVLKPDRKARGVRAVFHVTHAEREGNHASVSVSSSNMLSKTMPPCKPTLANIARPGGVEPIAVIALEAAGHDASGVGGAGTFQRQVVAVGNRRAHWFR